MMHIGLIVPSDASNKLTEAKGGPLARKYQHHEFDA
jgi:hypothetical protein